MGLGNEQKNGCRVRVSRKENGLVNVTIFDGDKRAATEKRGLSRGLTHEKEREQHYRCFSGEGGLGNGVAFP